MEGNWPGIYRRYIINRYCIYMEKIVWQSSSKSRHGPIFICLCLNAYCPLFFLSLCTLKKTPRIYRYFITYWLKVKTKRAKKTQSLKFYMAVKSSFMVKPVNITHTTFTIELWTWSSRSLQNTLCFIERDIDRRTADQAGPPVCGAKRRAVTVLSPRNLWSALIRLWSKEFRSWFVFIVHFPCMS